MSLRDKDVDTPELAYLSACARFQPCNHLHREAATYISKLRRRESARKLKSRTASNTKAKDTDIRYWQGSRENGNKRGICVH